MSGPLSPAPIGLNLLPGELVAWTNLNKNGTPNTDTLHAGLPVKKGTKYIIVSWIRERLPQKQYVKI